MNEPAVATQLRDIAARMRQASIAQRLQPYELKSTAQYLGSQAAVILAPILRQSGQNPMPPLWHKDWVLRGLRNQLGYYAGYDGNACRRKSLEFTQPNSLDVGEEEAEAWLKEQQSKVESRPVGEDDFIYESDMLLGEIKDFYFEQTEHWANMLEIAANRLHDTDCQPPGGEVTASEGPQPPNTWQRDGKSLLPHQMSDRAWKLVSFLWEQDGRCGAACAIADRYDEHVDVISLADWQKDANRFFRDAKLRWSVQKTGGSKEPLYTLVNQPPKTPLQK